MIASVELKQETFFKIIELIEKRPGESE